MKLNVEAFQNKVDRLFKIYSQNEIPISEKGKDFSFIFRDEGDFLEIEVNCHHAFSMTEDEMDCDVTPDSIDYYNVYFEVNNSNCSPPFESAIALTAIALYLQSKARERKIAFIVDTSSYLI